MTAVAQKPKIPKPGMPGTLGRAPGRPAGHGMGPALTQLAARKVAAGQAVAGQAVAGADRVAAPGHHVAPLASVFAMRHCVSLSPSESRERPIGGEQSPLADAVTMVDDYAMKCTTLANSEVLLLLSFLSIK